MSMTSSADFEISTHPSALTNGSSLFARHSDVDGRSAYARRFRDLINGHAADLGGEQILSEGQKALVRRASLLQTQLELLEHKIALRDDGLATSAEIDVYQRTTGALRRLLESLGLHQGRKPRTVAPDLREILRDVRREARAS